MSLGSSVSIVTRLQVECCSFRSRCSRFCLRPDRLWYLRSLLFNGYKWMFRHV